MNRIGRVIALASLLVFLSPARAQLPAPNTTITWTSAGGPYCFTFQTENGQPAHSGGGGFHRPY